MGKTLVNQLKKFVKRGMLIGLAAASIGVAGCKPYVDTTSYPAKINHAPTEILYISATSGEIPLSVELKSDGSDIDGKTEIKNYKLSIDEGNDGTIEETISQSTPIDITRNFAKAETIRIYGECTDAEGLTDKKETLIYTSSSDIPTLDLSGTNKDLIDGKSSTINLPSPIDDDTSGDIPYIKAESLDGETVPTLNGKQLTLQANPVSQDSPYKIKLTFGSASEGINTATLEGTIKNLCDISGVLQDNETHTPQTGIIKWFDGTIHYTELPSGTFDIHQTSPASQIKLQAQVGDSYIRTINLDGTKDYPNLIVRVVPNQSFSSKDDFRKFMSEINFGEDVLSGNYGLKKWNLDNLKGIEILLQNPNPVNESFSSSQQDLIKSKIINLNPKDIELYLNGYIFPSSQKDNPSLSFVQEDKSDTPEINKHYSSNGSIITGVDSGWIVVAPNTKLGYAGTTGNGYYVNPDIHTSTQTVISSLIQILPSDVDTYGINGHPVVSHEFGHAFIAQNGEASSLSGTYTIMDPDSYSLIPPCIPKVADIKAGQIIYEESYLPREKLDDILGMNW